MNDGSFRLGQSFIGNDNGYVYCSGGSENSKKPCIDTYTFAEWKYITNICFRLVSFGFLFQFIAMFAYANARTQHSNRLKLNEIEYYNGVVNVAMQQAIPVCSWIENHKTAIESWNFCAIVDSMRECCAANRHYPPIHLYRNTSTRSFSGAQAIVPVLLCMLGHHYDVSAVRLVVHDYLDLQKDKKREKNDIVDWMVNNLYRLCAVSVFLFIQFWMSLQSNVMSNGILSPTSDYFVPFYMPAKVFFCFLFLLCGRCCALMFYSISVIISCMHAYHSAITASHRTDNCIWYSRKMGMRHGAPFVSYLTVHFDEILY